MKARCIGPGLSTRAEPLERRDLLALENRDGRDAGEDRLAIDHHGAGTALAEPAAELGAVEGKLVAQHVEQRRIGIGGDIMLAAVDCKLHHGFSRWLESAGADAFPSVA